MRARPPRAGAITKPRSHACLVRSIESTDDVETMALPWTPVAQVTLTEVESYDWAVGGYHVIRNALSAAELAACRDAVAAASSPGRRPDTFEALEEHPQLLRALATVLPLGGTGPGGVGYRLDESFTPLCEGDAHPELKASGGSSGGPLGCRDPPHAIANLGATRGAHAVTAVWTLDDVPPGAGGIVCVPASHVLTAAAPPVLLSGKDDLGLVKQPGQAHGHDGHGAMLRAGDLLIMHASLLQGFRPTTARLLRGRFVEKMGPVGDVRFNAEAEARIARGEDEADAPSWVAELTPAQRAVMRLGDGDGREQSARVDTDGKRVWLNQPEQQQPTHRSIYREDPSTHGAIDPVEYFKWDLNGWLVIEDLMDEEWLAQTHAAIDWLYSTGQVRPRGNYFSRA